MTTGFKRMNEDVEDKARALLQALADQDGLPYDIIFIAVHESATEYTTIALTSKDMTQKHIPKGVVKSIMHSITRWLTIPRPE